MLRSHANKQKKTKTDLIFKYFLIFFSKQTFPLFKRFLFFLITILIKCSLISFYNQLINTSCSV